MTDTRKLLAAFAAGAFLLVTPALAEYPERPVTYILPWAQSVALSTWEPYLQECLGPKAEVVVLNRPGASGVLGVSELAATAPDGYTIGQLNMPNFVTAPIAGDVPYSIDSMDYLGAIVGSNATINVRADSPIRTLADLVALAKSSDKPIPIGMGGLGGDDHLAVLRFAKLAGVTFEYVPFGGGGAFRTALIGGHIDVAAFGEPDVSGFESQLHTLGIAAEKRSEFLPDVPTFKEQGFDLVAGSNHIVGAPRGTPPEALAKLRECIQTIPSNPAFQADAKKRNVPILPMTASEAEEFVRTQDKALRAIWETDPWIK